MLHAVHIVYSIYLPPIMRQLCWLNGQEYSRGSINRVVLACFPPCFNDIQVAVFGVFG